MTESQTFPERPLTKEEFLQRYMLLRAAIVSRFFSGDLIREAEGAWKEIQKAIKR